MQPVTPEPRSNAKAIVFAKHLPANLSENNVETKWKLSWVERMQMLLHGTLYLTAASFGQPFRMSVLREED